jgi:hypothetical protein
VGNLTGGGYEGGRLYYTVSLWRISLVFIQIEINFENQDMFCGCVAFVMISGAM